MARKSQPDQWKAGKGISLPPAMWARLDRLADAQDKSRSEVIEDFLTPLLALGDDLRKSHDNRQPVASGAVEFE